MEFFMQRLVYHVDTVATSEQRIHEVKAMRALWTSKFDITLYYSIYLVLELTFLGFENTTYSVVYCTGVIHLSRLPYLGFNSPKNTIRCLALDTAT